MIMNWYEAKCDYCGRTLDYFEKKRPTEEDIKRIGNVWDDGRIFCNDECKSYYHHDLNLRRCANLKQFREGKETKRQ